MAAKESRRVRYTKQALKESLLSLLREKPINKVTVSGICRRADINRSSFYLHYRDAYDLMEQIEQQLAEQIAQALDGPVNLLDNDVIIRVFQTIYDNRELCSVLFGRNGDRGFLARVITAQKERVLEAWGQLMPRYSGPELDYIYQFVTFGAVGMVEKWVLGGYKESLESLAQLLGAIIAQGLNHAAAAMDQNPSGVRRA